MIKVSMNSDDGDGGDNDDGVGDDDYNGGDSDGICE